MIKKIDSREQLINEFCCNGNLDKHRETLISIFNKIQDANCKISARYDYHKSSYHNSHIRISLKKQVYKKPEHILWTIFHEFGHFMTSPLKIEDINNKTKIYKNEESAWDYARTLLLDYPELKGYNEDFINYKNECIFTYK